MKCRFYPFFIFTALCVTACTKKETTPSPEPPSALFDSTPTAKPVPAYIKEASGIADSKTVPHTLWVAEDSGNPPQMYSLSYDGTVRKKVYVKGATNHGWEDMALSGGDIYIGDFGDNNVIRTEYAIYKFPEPDATMDTVYQFEKIRYQYPDGAHDADALLIDKTTKAIYIITKRDEPSLIYKIAFPYSDTEVNTAVKVGQLDYSGVTGSALSADGTEVVVKTYIALYYYKRNNNTIEVALQQKPISLPYRLEPQGESVAFAEDNSGLFTLSERAIAPYVDLYFYKRK